MEITDNKSNKRSINWINRSLFAGEYLGIAFGDLRWNKRNLNVYCKMQYAFEVVGIQRSVNDIKNKIKNLSKEYWYRIYFFIYAIDMINFDVTARYWYNFTLTPYERKYYQWKDDKLRKLSKRIALLSGTGVEKMNDEIISLHV